MGIDILPAIDLAYEAALEPRLWPAALEQVRETLGSDSASMLYQNARTGDGTGLTVRMPPEAVQLYFSHFGACNPLRFSWWRRSAARDGSFPLGIVTDQDVLPKSELLNCEYYGDFMTRFDMHGTLMIGVSSPAPYGASINVARSRKRDEFDAAEMDVARVLQRHLTRAFELTMRLDVQRSLADALDRSADAILLIDSGGEIVHLNCVAERLLADRPLGSRLRTMAAGGQSGSSFTLQRKSGRPLCGTIAPVKPDDLDWFRRRAVKIVCVTDPDRVRNVPADSLREAFGLTPAETRVAAALLTGTELNVIAKDLGVTIFTVRAHLARIMAKTGTTRQAELVALLGRIAVPSN